MIRLTNTLAIDRTPAWSSDGARIAFNSERDGQSEIYIMNADGSDQTRLTWGLAHDHGSTWSSDGSRIAFGSNLGGHFEIYTVKPDGSELTRLTDTPFPSDRPAWSP